MYKTNSLTKTSFDILINKSTEYPGTGEYNEFNKAGTYLCRNCGLALFRSSQKFISGCGWPSFDMEISSNVSKVLDKDGKRTEIICERCSGHLGHIFKNEGYTPLNTRYCVNSLSLDFVESTDILDTDEAILACGCFWGVEYYFKKLNGVLKTEVGYCGGSKLNPNYEEVCSQNTGHLEAIRIIFDPKVISYKQILKYFFEIHDFTQFTGQGPDIGNQYLSAIFYNNDSQYKEAKAIINVLSDKSYNVATKLYPSKPFWRAENYHQDYYGKNKLLPYCHKWQKIF